MDNRLSFSQKVSPKFTESLSYGFFFLPSQEYGFNDGHVVVDDDFAMDDKAVVSQSAIACSTSFSS